MQEFIFKLEDRLVIIEKFLCSVLLFSLVFVTVWGVFERFVLHIGMGWTDEVARYLSIYAVFIGASLGVYKSAHVGVDVFVRTLPESMNRITAIIAGALSALFCGCIAWTGFFYFLKLMDSQQVSPALRIPVCWIFLAIPLGCLLMMMHYIIQVVFGDREE